NSFYRYDDDNWCLRDYVDLVDNFFNSLVTTFWFEYLKPAKQFDVQRPVGEIELFFEDYSRDILRKCFYFYKHSHALYLDELKVQRKNNIIEICDFLVKKNKKILLGEIKSSQINMNLKYPDNPVEVYQQNNNKFKKDYGIEQIAHAIWLLNVNINVFPIELNKNHKYSVFPVLVMNERLFQ